MLAAIRDGIRPAFERQRSVLVDELRPIARPDDRAGLTHVPGGDAAYARLVRAHTTLDLAPEAIHAIGLEETERIDREFAGLGSQVLGTTGVSATLARLRDDPALRFTTRDEVRATAEDALRRANDAIGGWFGRLPHAPCEVVVMGDHEAKHSTIAYYRQPAADGSRPGRYYINTSEPTTRPRYEAEVLAFHEAVPGHHLQIAIAQELPDLPAFRRFSGPTAYVEGWGLYTERLCDEMGLYSGPLDRFGVLSFDAWRASRLVVDTGLHALGWSRARAIEFMLAHTALAENNIVNEVDRYLAMPGQALAYKLGQLELRRLRRESEAALGGGVRHPLLPRRRALGRSGWAGDPGRRRCGLDGGAALSLTVTDRWTPRRTQRLPRRRGSVPSGRSWATPASDGSSWPGRAGSPPMARSWSGSSSSRSLRAVRSRSGCWASPGRRPRSSRDPWRGCSRPAPTRPACCASSTSPGRPRPPR